MGEKKDVPLRPPAQGVIDYAFFHKSVPLNAWQLCMMKYHRISDLACNAQRCQQPAIDNANVQDYSPD
ncbi:hypothetical protein BN1200_900046 [Klebsiella variicola]|nr:hypothetical protein SB4536_2110020 [Klebsiella pneumoniae subsp. pneumoniae T69]CDI26238.1 hypothetical protein KPST86_490352 [Klebsiella pneumoniae subsp. pneumoniae SA1]CDI26847.1 hypothetical protein KPST380_720043 [Klebsiella pneumoniae subsp. pneumoniae BJ1-GA]CEL87722.1 hypothetical protein KVR801_460262 [Klebsiella variicola]CEP32749.1 hypothetical protein KV8917_760024 [Klebsiella variicola]